MGGTSCRVTHYVRVYKNLPSCYITFGHFVLACAGLPAKGFRRVALLSYMSPAPHVACSDPGTAGKHRAALLSGLMSHLARLPVRMPTLDEFAQGPQFWQAVLADDLVGELCEQALIV